MTSIKTAEWTHPENDRWDLDVGDYHILVDVTEGPDPDDGEHKILYFVRIRDDGNDDIAESDFRDEPFGTLAEAQQAAVKWLADYCRAERRAMRQTLKMLGVWRGKSAP
jgi:hypothetical protein